LCPWNWDKRGVKKKGKIEGLVLGGVGFTSRTRGVPSWSARFHYERWEGMLGLRGDLLVLEKKK